MALTRRDFMKRNAAAAAATAAGLLLPTVTLADETSVESDNIKWDKAPCRFCGVGCGVLVGTQNGRVVACQGDPDSTVNRGLNCIKGYFLPKIMYGKDRLTQPLLRMTNGKFDKEGEFTPISWHAAFDIMADKFKAALKAKGPQSVGMLGSGQWTLWEGYAATKLMRAGFRSNNLDSNSRHRIASAESGAMRSFGLDQTMGCYDDIEEADAFVLWGANMAEMHPVLWSRITDRRQSDDRTHVTTLSTHSNRSSDLADNTIVFKPQSDLVILNFIANYLIENKAYSISFINKYVNFARGESDIGYGFRPTHSLEKEAINRANPGATTAISFAEFRRFVSKYTLDYTVAMSGVPEEQLLHLAQLYADPRKNIVSFWCMDINQHTRGVWANNMCYNLHLLTGKIAKPGCGPFALSHHPSDCGTSREVGIFSHRLPAGMVVSRKEHRDIAEHIWSLPEGTLPDKIGLDAISQDRELKDGSLNAYWSLCNNNMQSGPNISQDRMAGWRNPENFIVVSDAYPTISALSADLILPTAMWVEKEGAYGNAERRTQFWHQQVKAPGQAKSDLWQLVEFSKRFTLGDVWPKEFFVGQASLKSKTLYQCLFANGVVDKFKLSGLPDGELNDEANDFGFYLQKGLFEEYAQFGRDRGYDLASFDLYHKVNGLRWPVINGKETLWRYRAEVDPYIVKGELLRFYGQKDGRAIIFALPYEPAPEKPDSQYDFWLSACEVLEHWNSGSMTRRVPELHRAMPESVVFMNPQDALNNHLRRGDKVKIISRRGSVVTMVETKGRNKPPRGLLLMPLFDAAQLVNGLTLDAMDPISKQADFRKCAVRIEKI